MRVVPSRGPVALVALLLVTACGENAPVSPRSAAGGRMRQLLEKIAFDTPRSNPYMGSKRAEELRRDLDEFPDETPVSERFEATLNLAREELRLGNTTRAVALYKAVDTLAQDTPQTVVSAGQLAYETGVAHLRLGEVDNCTGEHSVDSCLFPIQGQGIHRQTSGSRTAMTHLARAIRLLGKHDPAHGASVWLLNVAAMTLGKWPAAVPEPLRLRADRLKSDVAFPRFANVAVGLRLDTFDLAGGAVVDDFDGDGCLDLMTSSWDPLDPMHCFRNLGNGRFADVTSEAGLDGLLGGINMVQADYDNDGDVDIFVLRGAWLGRHGWHPNSLLQNDGHGHFTDVTFDAGLGEHHYPTQTAAWADFDADGDLDLYIGNESVAPFGAPSQLFRNNGDGTFTDIAAAAGVRNDRYSKAVAWGDYDSDGDPDLFVSNYGQPNRLYRNDGSRGFKDVAAEVGVGQPLASFPAWFWDYDNDGAMDLFVSSYDASVADVAAHYCGKTLTDHLPALYKGDGQGGFEDVAQAAGIARPMLPMGSNFGDLDGDGYLDFYLGTGEPDYAAVMPNVMFLNQGGRRFADVTIAGGFGQLQKGHAVAFADFDHDGDMDLFQEVGGAFPGDRYMNALYENPGFDHRWLTLRVEGRASNRSAIGARIHVRVRDAAGERSIYRHVGSGGSFGASPLRQLLGLGAATALVRVEVFWPTTGKTQVVTGLELDQAYLVVEGQAQARPLKLPALPALGGAR